METDYTVKQIIQRYNITDAEGLFDANAQMKYAFVNTEFLRKLLAVFTGESKFNRRDFDDFSIPVLTDYILRTHKYYLNIKLLEIEQSIHLLLADYSDKHPLLYLLYGFYAHYKVELADHIRDEETTLLPYITYLQQCDQKGFTPNEYFTRTQNYSLQKFVDSHHDTEVDLCEIRKIISRYSPPPTNQTPYRILLAQLEVFEKDLNIHALIEDKVLIPKALRLEKKLNRNFSSKIKLN